MAEQIGLFGDHPKPPKAQENPEKQGLQPITPLLVVEDAGGTVTLRVEGMALRRYGPHRGGRPRVTP